MDKTKISMVLYAALVAACPTFGYTATNGVNHDQQTTVQELLPPSGKMNRELQIRIDADLENTVDMLNGATPSTETIAKQTAPDTAKEIEKSENSLVALINKIISALD